MATNEKLLHDLSPEDYKYADNDTPLKSSADTYKDPESLFSAEPSPSRPRPRRAREFLLLLCLVTFTYITTFYTITFFDSNSEDIIGAIVDLPSKTYANMATQYTAYHHPPTKQEVADLVTDLYDLLSEMGYFPPEAINRPPHPTSRNINTTLARELGYSEEAIQMMEMLPYINTTGEDDVFTWSHGGWGGEFIHEGRFVDLTDDEMLGFRDPFHNVEYVDGEPKGWDEDGGKYMYPDYIILSQKAQDGVVMVLNVGNLKLWTISSYDQEMQNADPGTQHIERTDIYPNWLSIENFPSRLARDALRDYIENFKNLTWLPGGLQPGTWEGDSYIEIYKTNGWGTENFNRAAFLADVAAWEEAEGKRPIAEEPFETTEMWNKALENLYAKIERIDKAVKEFDEGEGEAWDRKMSEEEREKYRKELVERKETEISYIPWTKEKIEAARPALEAVDPAVKDARERRIQKYGS